MTTDHIKMLQATVDKSRATIHDDGTVSVGRRRTMGNTLDELARHTGMVYIDIDKIQNLEEVKAMLKILVMAHGVGSPELRIHVDVMNKMPILNNLVRD